MDKCVAEMRVSDPEFCFLHWLLVLGAGRPTNWNMACIFDNLTDIYMWQGKVTQLEKKGTKRGRKTALKRTIQSSWTKLTAKEIEKEVGK